MPEPTTTVLQEWERLNKLISYENIFEKFTEGELRFIKFNYNAENREIYSFSYNIRKNLLKLMPMISNKIVNEIDMIGKIKKYDRLYSIIISYIVIEKIMKITSDEIFQKLINNVKNKIYTIKNCIDEELLSSEPETINLYNTFNLFERIVNQD